jgi:SAM-dependent methyltransferase
MSNVPNDENFFAFHEAGSRKSARATVPLVLEYLQPASVVDVGCGTGIWLAEFAAAGVRDYLGVDGDDVKRETLLIEPDRFMAHNLEQPLGLDRRFDLALSLEVAEHLPPASAAGFVASLVALAPVVLFSAAIPHQGGPEQVNEQWPEYWRDEFATHDYVVVDCLRERLWQHKDLSPQYAQNLLFFVERARSHEYPLLDDWFRRAGEFPRLSLVHPEHYLKIHRHLIGLYRDSQRMTMRYAFQLRDINLIAFPDWALPQETLYSQLRQLFRAVLTHPAGSSIALVVYYTDDADGTALTRLGLEVLRPGGVAISGAPAITGIPKASDADQWEALLPLIDWRVVLPNDDAAAIAAAGAGALPAVPLESIQNKQPLIGR